MRLEAISSLGGRHGAVNMLPDLDQLGARERSDIGCVLITAGASARERAKSIGLAIGCSLPLTHGLVVECDGKSAIWLTPRSWLILGSPEDEDRIVRSIESNFADRSVLASRYSDALCWLTLEGPQASGALSQGGFISLSEDGLGEGHAKRTPLAGIPAIVFREAKARWTIGVERSRASYFTAWLSRLTHEFGESA